MATLLEMTARAMGRNAPLHSAEPLCEGPSCEPWPALSNHGTSSICWLDDPIFSLLPMNIQSAAISVSGTVLGAGDTKDSLCFQELKVLEKTCKQMGNDIAEDM